MAVCAGDPDENEAIGACDELMPPKTYWSPEVAFMDAVKLCSASSPVLLRLKSADAEEFHWTRLCSVDWAVERIESIAAEAAEREPDAKALDAVIVVSRSS